jgi:hypothetical protein
MGLLCDRIRRLAQRELPSHDQLTRNELMAEAYQPAEGFVDEVWLPVPGWEESYMVSDLGRVKSLDRTCSRSGGKGDVQKMGVVLRPESIGRHGHMRVKLQAHGQSKYVYVHDLVFAVFSAPCPAGSKVQHLDGNPANNAAANLECTKVYTKEELAQEKLKSKARAAKIKAFKRAIDSAIKKTPGYVPSKEELDAAFIYRDGVLYWRKDRGSHIRAGAEAGTPRHGYVQISFKGRSYPAHRLIWAMHGNAPAETIDHINRDRSDNRIENLRSATKGQQLFNTGLRSDNKSGTKGVSWHKDAQAWRGQVCFRGKAYTAGIFDSKEECAEAVRVLRERLHGEHAHHATTA